MFRKQNAFTLVELMVTLVVLGIVLAIALPSFKSQILSNKSTALSEDLITALNFVRSEAVKQGVPVQGGSSAKFITLCASIDSTTCSNSATDWPSGFIAVVDYATTEAAGAPVLTDSTHAVSTILRVWPKADDKAAISVIQKTSTTPISFIRYASSGKLAVTANPADSIRIKTKMKDNGQGQDCIINSGRTVDINVVGMVRATNKDCW